MFQSNSAASLPSPWLVIIKAILLVMILNFTFPLWGSALNQVSAYNLLLPGRLRFPYGGKDPNSIYSSSIMGLDTIFASHNIARHKVEGEYRVVILGDSSIWGFGLRPNETLAAQLDSLGLTACSGRPVRVYNLGFPGSSVTKDLLILDHATRYQPDLVLWMITLVGLTPDRRLDHALLTENIQPLMMLNEKYNLRLNSPGEEPSFWNQTLIEQRSEIKAGIRFQLNGFLWAATGVDQNYEPSGITVRLPLRGDPVYNDQIQPPLLDKNMLSLDILGAGVETAGSIPLILVNEPILIRDGEQYSDIRYNNPYPRWIYDQYRQIMAAESRQNGWGYLDFWDSIPANEFNLDADLHLTPTGENDLARLLSPYILEQSCP